MLNMKNGCHLVTFVSSLQTFQAHCKVSICHERKHKKYQNFVVRAFKTKQVPSCFFTPWLPGKSDLGEVLKWRKIKRPLKLRIWNKTVQVTFHVV